jgi:hypothetical protein
MCDCSKEWADSFKEIITHKFKIEEKKKDNLPVVII